MDCRVTDLIDKLLSVSIEVGSNLIGLFGSTLESAEVKGNLELEFGQPVSALPPHRGARDRRGGRSRPHSTSSQRSTRGWLGSSKNARPLSRRGGSRTSGLPRPRAARRSRARSPRSRPSARARGRTFGAASASPSAVSATNRWRSPRRPRGGGVWSSRVLDRADGAAAKSPGVLVPHAAPRLCPVASSTSGSRCPRSAASRAHRRRRRHP